MITFCGMNIIKWGDSMGNTKRKEQLIKEVLALSKKLGRTPKRREFKSYSAANYHFGTWNNFLKKSGLIPLKQFDLSLDEYKEYIHDFVKKNNRTPTKDDFDENIYLPDARTMERKFEKPWSQILADLGYEPNIRMHHEEYFNSLSDKELLSIFKEEILRLETNMRVYYDKNRKDQTPSFAQMQKRFNKTWTELLESLNIETIKQIKTKEECIQILKDLNKKLGRAPSISETEAAGFKREIFKSNFGNFNNAVRAAGLDPRTTPSIVTETDDELLNMYIEFSEDIGKDEYGATSLDLNGSDDVYNVDVFMIRFGNMEELRKQAGFKTKPYKRKYTKENITTLLLDEYKKVNRRLTNTELKNISKEREGFPSISTICRHFKTTKMSEVWNEIEK